MPYKITPIPLGTVFGRWVTIHEGFLFQTPTGLREKRVLCRCACGTEKDVLYAILKKGGSRSCGCLRDELASVRFAKHRLCATPEYVVWAGVLSRCNCPNAGSYRNYGGRGISVCAEWKSDFTTFLSDMGQRPGPKYQIDRIDVNGNYSPENCRWVTATVNGNNRRNNVRYTFEGESLTASEWARRIGIPLKTLGWRLKAGWELSRALSK